MERERLAKLEIAKERRLRAKQKKEERLSLSPSKKMESQKLEEQNQKLLTKSVLKSYQKKKKRAKAMILEDSSDEMSISGKSSSVRVARLLRSLHRNNTDVESAICGVCKYAAGLDVGQEAEAARTLSAIIPFCTIERYVMAPMSIRGLLGVAEILAERHDSCKNLVRGAFIIAVVDTAVSILKQNLFSDDLCTLCSALRIISYAKFPSEGVQKYVIYSSLLIRLEDKLLSMKIEKSSLLLLRAVYGLLDHLTSEHVCDALASLMKRSSLFRIVSTLLAVYHHPSDSALSEEVATLGPTRDQQFCIPWTPAESARDTYKHRTTV